MTSKALSRYQLIKPTALVHTATQGLQGDDLYLGNLLLKSAQASNGEIRSENAVKVRDVLEAFGTKTRNDEWVLKALLERIARLQKTVLPYNILGKDKRQRLGSTQLLGPSSINGGINGELQYSFPKETLELFIKPALYGKINALAQVSLRKNKPALKMHEYFENELANSGLLDLTTAWVSVQDWAKLVGAPDTTYYQDFRRFSERFVVKPLKMVNELSEFEATHEYRRHLRKVTDLRFHIKRKESWQPPKTLPIAESIFGRADEIALRLETAPLTAEEKKAFHELKANGLRSETARQLLVSYGPERCHLNARYARRRKEAYDKQGKEASLAALTRKAIHDNWAAQAEGLSPSEQKQAARQGTRVRQAEEFREVEALAKEIRASYLLAQCAFVKTFLGRQPQAKADALIAQGLEVAGPMARREYDAQGVSGVVFPKVIFKELLNEGQVPANLRSVEAYAHENFQSRKQLSQALRWLA